jgi:hypothetical protein
MGKTVAFALDNRPHAKPDQLAPISKLTAILAIDRSRGNHYPWGMDVIPIRPERKAQLEEYAQRHGQDLAAALDDVLAEFLELDRREFEESVTAIGRGYEDVKAGRTRSAAEFLEDLRREHGFPR